MIEPQEARESPRSEGGNPKELRNLKTEIRTLLGRHAKASRLLAFGLRSSDFRCRGLGFRLACLVITAAAAGCRRDMFQQPYSKPLKPSDFFLEDHMASRPLVAHTVARGHLNADQAFYTGKLGTNLVNTFPMPITREI